MKTLPHPLRRAIAGLLLAATLPHGAHAQAATNPALAQADPVPVEPAAPTLEFTQLQDLPAAGIRMAVMKDAVRLEMPPLQPMRMPAIGDQPAQLMFKPFELWRRNQTVGHWADVHGNVLMLARVSMPLPRRFLTGPIAMPDYERMARDAEAAATVWNMPALGSWTAAFLGEPNISLGMPRGAPAQFSGLARCLAHEGDSPRESYLFRLKDGKGMAANWFLASLDLAEDSEAARQAFRSAFLGNVYLLPPQTVDQPPGP